MSLRLFLLFALLTSCITTPPAEQRDELLATIYFYRGNDIGEKSPPTGLLRLSDDRTQFEHLAWRELITSSVAVAPGGEWIYLACGNGVLVSRDGGQSWFLTGGIEMSEVQGLWIDPDDPRSAWSAGAYGLFHCENILEESPWKRLVHDDVFRYCNDVRQDSRDADVLWVASERGIVEVRNGKATRRGPDVRTGVVVQDTVDPERWWATTDGLGVLTSLDGGANWRALAGSPSISFCIERPPGEERTLLVGAIGGVWRSDDLGATWTLRSRGLPEEYFVFSIDADPKDARHLCIAGSEGVYESSNGGEDWRLLGLAAALCSEVRFAERAIVPRRGPPEGVERPAIGRGEPPVEFRPEDEEFEARRKRLSDYFHAKLPGPDAEKIGIFTAILAAFEEEPDPRLEEFLLATLEEPAHSMFFSFPAIGLYLHAREKLPEAVVERLEELLTEYEIYRGDTENHWVMHYTAMLLAAQTWPELSAQHWYMGRSSASLYAEAREWLVHWARLTATQGQGEYDSPHYMFMYVTPMLLLYDFAEEPEMKQLAGMMLDLLLVDYLSESLEGAYCGGHSRAPGKAVQETTDNRATAYHYLYAGGIEQPEKVHGWLIPAVLSSYVPPREFGPVANRREELFTHLEGKRVRNVIRFGDELNPPVYKTNYMTPGYCLGSTQGGILQPIQQHTWDVTWLGSESNSTLFTVHPSYAGSELGMFFPEEVHFLTTSVAGQKGTYTSPDKWYSASPWERVFQRENVLLALYDVPKGWNFEHVNLFWPHCLQREEEGGWLFGRDGDFSAAVYSTREGSWSEETENDRLRIDGSRAGFVVVTATTGQSYDEFKQATLARAKPRLVGEEGDPVLQFESLECRFGSADPFPRDVLFDGPFVKGKRGIGVIEITDGETSRFLDFRDFSIRTEVVDR
jgi:hypothetical protein